MRAVVAFDAQSASTIGLLAPPLAAPVSVVGWFAKSWADISIGPKSGTSSVPTTSSASGRDTAGYSSIVDGSSEENVTATLEDCAVTVCPPEVPDVVA